MKKPFQVGKTKVCAPTLGREILSRTEHAFHNDSNGDRTCGGNYETGEVDR